MEKRKSIVSDATNIYTKFLYTYQEEKGESDDDKKTICPISHAPLAESKQYFDWIEVINTSQTNPTAYYLPSLLAYFAAHNMRNVPDPQRAMPCLDFLLTRLNKIKNMDTQVRELAFNAVTDELKDKTMRDILDAWHDDTPIPKPLSDLSIILGLATYEKHKLVHPKLTAEVAVSMLKESPAGTFLVRESSKNAGDGRGQATVFSITYSYSNNEGNNSSGDDSYTSNTTRAHNIRFLAVHGVGVYSLTWGHDKNLPCVPIPDHLLNELQMDKIFEHLIAKNRSIVPQYACITDLLLDLQARGYIATGQMIPYQAEK